MLFLETRKLLVSNEFFKLRFTYVWTPGLLNGIELLSLYLPALYCKPTLSNKFKITMHHTLYFSNHPHYWTFTYIFMYAYACACVCWIEIFLVLESKLDSCFKTLSTTSCWLVKSMATHWVLSTQISYCYCCKSLNIRLRVLTFTLN